MADESKPESKPNVPPPSLSKPKPPSQPLPDPPTDAPPPDPATTPEPHGDPGATAPPGPPPEEKREVTNPELDPSVPPAEPGALAPLQSRLVAGLIDGVVAMGLYFIALMLLPDAIDNLVAWLLMAGYWIVRDSLPPLKGQSLGKSAMRLKAVKEGGDDLVGDWKTAAIRNVILIVPIIGLIEVIVLIARKDGPDKGRRLGDEWAKTKVVVAES